MSQLFGLAKLQKFHDGESIGNIRKYIEVRY